MSKYINEHSLSVGYNLDGQNFFDVLNKYHNYIHSYFFSLTRSMKGNMLKADEVLDKLKNCNTYNIPGNLLLNHPDDQSNWDELITIAKKAVNINAITLISLDNIEDIKQKYPELEIHLSVRFFDWNFNIPDYMLISRDEDIIKKYVDVINISGSKSFNDGSLVDYIHSLGCKTKMIVNEGCIINRHENYKLFYGYNNCRCDVGKCFRTCDSITRDYPWMTLSRINLFKEIIEYDRNRFDILKISARSLSNDKIDHMLEYWTSEDQTSIIFNSINTERNYPAFREYCKRKMECNGICIKCMDCKKFYTAFTK